MIKSNNVFLDFYVESVYTLDLMLRFNLGY